MSSDSQEEATCSWVGGQGAAGGGGTDSHEVEHRHVYTCLMLEGYNKRIRQDNNVFTKHTRNDYW